MASQAWFQTSLGQRHEVPDTNEFPILVGRIGGKGAAANAIGIEQSEYTMTVSRQHAHLWCNDAGEWEIADAGASHGLFLEGERLTPGQRHPLPPGAKVSLGKYELTFCVGGAEDGGDVTLVGDMEGGGGGTMVLSEFKPSELTPAFKGSGEDAPAAPAGPRLFFDVLLNDRVTHLELPRDAGVSTWTVGRGSRKPPSDPDGTDHLQVPNQEGTKSVSRKHAQVRCDGDAYFIKSLSSQGILVSQRPVSGEDETALQSGDKIVMGSCVFIFRVGDLQSDYKHAEFDLAEARGLTATATLDGGAVDPDDMPTREIPRDVYKTMLGAPPDEEQAWGYLVENKLLDPRRYALVKRRTRIGSHPLNSDIKMEGPGITDNFAVIQWGSKDVRVISKAAGTPVRVDHSPYRKSPALKDGSIITLGTREYLLNLSGKPPEATGSIVARKIRRSILAFVIVMNLAFFGTMGGIMAITPKPHASTIPEPPNDTELVRDVVQNYGLTGLKLLESTDAYAQMENDAIFDALYALNDAHRMVHKLPARRFDDNVAKIEGKIREGARVFELAGLDPGLANSGWFASDINDVFTARRESAYASQWNDLLQALEQTNIGNAKRLLKELTHFPKEKLQAARDVVALWERNADATTDKKEDDILQEFRAACNKAKSFDYIADESERLDALIADYDKIRGDTSEPAQALVRSVKWRTYHNHVTTLRVTLSLLEHYQTGNVAEFNKVVTKINPGSQSTLVNSMRTNLAKWQEWNGRYNATKDPLADFTLLSELKQLNLLLISTLDPKCVLAKTIKQKITAFEEKRGDSAAALRAKAQTMPDDFEKLMKLIEAYSYDPHNESAESELDNLGVKLCGKIHKEKSAAQHKKELEDVLNRYEELSRKGILVLDNVISYKQVKTLLDSLK